MQELNLPQFDLKIKTENGKDYIFDIIRKKHLLLTPEEWVRQHFIHFLIYHYKYPKSLFKIESGLKYNSLKKRSDILVYNREGNPFLLVECKSADVKVSQDSFVQIAMYNYSIKAGYIIVTNGLKHYCCAVDHENKKYEFIKDIPAFLDLE